MKALATVSYGIGIITLLLVSWLYALVIIVAVSIGLLFTQITLAAINRCVSTFRLTQ